MQAIFDHAFIWTGFGAPVADRLRDMGFTEGSPNRHSGQGTACRRFFFRNAMLELIWVADAEEARNGDARLKLWERWSGAGTSPFGILLRPASPSHGGCPFSAWEYRPGQMPGLVLQVATEAGLDEPFWAYNGYGIAPADWPLERRQPMEHVAGVQEVTAVTLSCPRLREGSLTGRMARETLILLQSPAPHCLELEFDRGESGRHVDFRPDLSLVCRW